MNDAVFDDLADVYEAMIDWPKRLAHEEPFYRRLFERLGVRSLVDVACGTGRHAAMFHAWGLSVEGADVSPAMIQRARRRFGEPPGLRWVVRDFTEPIRADAPFDAALCVGNSLALAPAMNAVGEAIHRMTAAVRPGGVVVVHLLNLWRLADGPCVWQKCKRVALPQGEAIVIKGVHRAGSRGYVELLVAPLAESGQMTTDTVPLLGIEAKDLLAAFRQAGATRADCFGGYRDEPYDRRTSTDLILVAKK